MTPYALFPLAIEGRGITELYMETGGHYWHKGKFKIEITEHLGDSQPDPTGSKFGA